MTKLNLTFHIAQIYQDMLSNLEWYWSIANKIMLRALIQVVLQEYIPACGVYVENEVAKLQAQQSLIVQENSLEWMLGATLVA